MIRYLHGNILQAEAEALVNSVNTVGVMGKGVALAFKKAYPENFKRYKAACEDGSLTVGKLLTVPTGQLRPRLIINFPTKKHWRHPSQMAYLQAGLSALVEVIRQEKLTSIALPPLGCGNGKLNWSEVKPLIEQSLTPVAEKCDIQVFEPGYQPVQTQGARRAELTPARAMLLTGLRYYLALGDDINLLVAGYFLERLGEPLRLRYERGHYGPYSHPLVKVLQYLNGTYLRFDGASVKPDTHIELVPVTFAEVDTYRKAQLNAAQQLCLKRLQALMEGFETPFSMELLATVDFVQQAKHEASLEEIRTVITDWTQRKAQLMQPQYIELAYHHLAQHLPTHPQGRLEV